MTNHMVVLSARFQLPLGKLDPREAGFDTSRGQDAVRIALTP